ncbi:MAG TPA: WD40 repeat domain-containing protein, partial [Gemmatirosa sp.]
LDSNQFLARAVFDPHGTRLVTTAATGIIRVWNVVRGRHAAHDAPMFQLDLHPPDNMPTVAAALIGDGRVLGASGTHVLAWHLPGTPMAGQPADSIGTHTGTVQAVAVAPDGRTAASVGDDSSARIWRIAHGDALAGNPVLELAHPARVRTVRFASHGRWLVTTAVDRRVRLWDTERQGVVPLLQAPPGDVARLAFDPTGGRVLAASEAGVVRVWNAVDSGAPARTLAAIPPDLRDLTYSRDGARVVAVRGDGALVVWSADGLDPPGPPRATAPAVPAGAASPDGRSVVTAEGATVRVWDAGVTTPRRVLSGHHDAVLSAVFAPDGRHIASTGADRTAIVWDVATGDSVVLRGHTDKVRSAVFSPDGRSVATIADDGTVRVWNVNGTGTPLVTPRTNVPLTAVAFSPDGAHVAAAGGSGLVRIWPITWTALMAAVRAAVPGCLGVQARQTLRAMAPEEASDAYAACVAAHGRQHAGR